MILHSINYFLFQVGGISLQLRCSYVAVTLQSSSNRTEKIRSEAGPYDVDDPGLQRVEKRLAEKISEINLPFEEELKTIEEY
jgi:hypothetical protein